MPPLSRVASLCASIALVLTSAAVAAVPAHADNASHRLRAAKAQAAKLDAQARTQAKVVASARSELAALDQQSNAALAAVQAAAAFSLRAAAEQAAAETVLAAATQRTAAAQVTLDTLAANAYRNQAAGGSMAATLQLVGSGDPTTLLDGMSLLDQLSRHQNDALQEFQLAQAQQQRASEQAAQAAATASAALAGARTAKQEADTLVGQQRKAVSTLDTLLSRTRTAAKQAHRNAANIAHEIAVAEARAAAFRRAQALAAAHMPVPRCDGSSLTGYANGNLPSGALCALWGAPGEMLRKDAADAFNAMSHAYAAAFGEPLCVTASYRTYQRQVELYASMPAGYAAVPGTSNHGWAIAVDLCGGIQVDSSPQHQWLLDHAAQFNWFHPAWAMPGGPGPHEPWHWEFAG